MRLIIEATSQGDAAQAITFSEGAGDTFERILRDIPAGYVVEIERMPDDAAFQGALVRDYTLEGVEPHPYPAYGRVMSLKVRPYDEDDPEANLPEYARAHERPAFYIPLSHVVSVHVY